MAGQHLLTDSSVLGMFCPFVMLR